MDKVEGWKKNLTISSDNNEGSPVCNSALKNLPKQTMKFPESWSERLRNNSFTQE